MFKFEIGAHVYARALLSRGPRVASDHSLIVTGRYLNRYGFPIYQLFDVFGSELELPQLCLSR